MSKAIELACSLEEVVEIINSDEYPYFGGTDLRDAEEQAGEYAFSAAENTDDLTIESLEGQLDYLAEAGAKFDFNKALENAISRVEEFRIENN